MGGTGAHSSGDLFLCFATGNRTLARTSFRTDPRITLDIRALNDFAIGPLFDATIEATEEAILNALVAAETMTGRDGITATALPHDRLVEAMARFGRPAQPSGPSRVGSASRDAGLGEDGGPTTDGNVAR